MEELAKALDKTLFEVGSDVIKDWAQAGVDGILGNSLVSRIPFVSTVCAMVRGGLAIKERNLLKQTSAFVLAFKNERGDSPECDEYKSRVVSDPAFRQNEAERALIFLDGCADVEKSEILGRLYASFISGDVGYENYRDLVALLDTLLLGDLDLLTEVDRGLNKTSATNRARVSRLASSGLLQTSLANLHLERGAMVQDSYVSLTDLGRDLLKCY